MKTRNFSKPYVLTACIGAGRHPTDCEMDRLANRVWREIRSGTREWGDVAVGSAAYRRTMSIARAAVSPESI